MRFDDDARNGEISRPAGRSRSGSFMLLRLLTTAAFFSACGCEGTPEPSTYKVSGLVTWGGGEPLDDGDIILSASEGRGPAAGKITHGTYQLWASPGRKQVSIRASRLVADSKGAQGEPVFDNFIPARYNVSTTLKAD